MAPAKGKLLIAEPFLKDGHFSRTVIFLCEHSAEGSVGFVLNQDTDLTLGEILIELASSKEPVYQGGPVQHDTLHMLHRLPELLGGKEVAESIYWGGSFDSLQELVAGNNYQPNSVKLFLGYAGWAAGQLEAELEEGSWLVADANPDIIFHTDSDDVWRKAIALLGKEYHYLAQLPIDPQLN